MKNKWFWRLLLIINLCLFIYSIFTKNILAILASLILVLFINYKGKDILFDKYEEKVLDNKNSSK